MKRLAAISLLLLLTVTATVSAFDFKKVVAGQTLYFTILSAGDNATVALVAPLDNGRYGDFPTPQGRLTIPDEVSSDGVRYRVTAIGDRAFAGCGRLQALTVPRWVTTVGNAAFEGCGNLHTMVFLCDSLATMNGAFKGCVSIDSLVIGPSVRFMPSFAFYNLEKVGVVVFQAVKAVSMNYLFFGCTDSARIVFDERVGSVPPFLCYNFMGLSEVEFAKGTPSLSTIGQCAFANCTSLRSIVLPVSVNLIESNAFSYCRLQRLELLSPQAPYLLETPFFGVDKATQVLIPCGSRQNYVNSALGRYFEHFDYPKGCPTDPLQAEVVYIHDTVWLHDTVYLPEPAFRQRLEASADTVGKSPSMYDHVEVDLSGRIRESDPAAWIFLDGKIVRITHAKRLTGIAVKAYDENGRLVVDERIPADQPSDNYYLKLPKKKRYFLTIGNLPTISVDIPSQRISY